MSKSRLEAFSDGVFAIVVTLLVLDLKGPDERHSIASALAGQKYTIAAYVVAFLMVGVLWINHHGVFRFAARVDRTLTFLNLVFLLLLAATPFTASLYAEGLRRGGFDAKVAAAVFSAVFLGMSLIYGSMWFLVSRPQVLLEHLDPLAARRALGRFGAGNFVYVALIGLSFLTPLGVLIIHGLIAVYYAFDQLDPAKLERAPD